MLSKLKYHGFVSKYNFEHISQDSGTVFLNISIMKFYLGFGFEQVKYDIGAQIYVPSIAQYARCIYLINDPEN